MKESDLIELLRSTVESDALVSRLFRLYHIEYNYSLWELNRIIEFGIQNGYFTIENVSSENINYTDIDWSLDNTYQEVLMINKDRYSKELFSGKGKVLNDFFQFVDK